MDILQKGLLQSSLIGNRNYMEGIDYEEVIDLPKVLETLMITISGIIVLQAYNFYRLQMAQVAIVMFMLFFVNVSLILLNRKGQHFLAGILLLLLFAAEITYVIIIGDGIYDVTMIAFPIMIVFSAVLFGKRAVPFMMSISIGLTGFVYSLGVWGVIIPPIEPRTYRLEDMLIQVVFLLAMGFLLGVIMDIIDRNIKKIVRTEILLLDAYDLTLEGWARALELRDKGTEGHSRRVVHMTLQLAVYMGLPHEDYVHIRRGALLHDIGKMAVPDHILRKPGKLDPDEWDVVKEHPAKAKELLESIEYLQPALDIPYSHHENWDGTGYPLGVKGEDIPLPVRIFAVVDNWDALTSNRPYRDAWSEDKVIKYIKSEAGKKFDPKVVIAFTDMINGLHQMLNNNKGQMAYSSS